MPNKPITVNVDEWMKGNGSERLQPAVNLPDYKLSPEEAAMVEKRRADMTNAMNRMEDIAAREGLLDAEARECGECGTVEACYKDDYICYKCRDAKEAEE